MGRNRRVIAVKPLDEVAARPIQTVLLPTPSLEKSIGNAVVSNLADDCSRSL